MHTFDNHTGIISHDVRASSRWCDPLRAFAVRLNRISMYFSRVFEQWNGCFLWESAPTKGRLAAWLYCVKVSANAHKHTTHRMDLIIKFDYFIFADLVDPSPCYRERYARNMSYACVQTPDEASSRHYNNAQCASMLLSHTGSIIYQQRCCVRWLVILQSVFGLTCYRINIICIMSDCVFGRGDN